MAALPAFNYTVSTEMNWALSPGAAATVQSKLKRARSQLDRTYHKIYKPERVAVQDDIVKKSLEKSMSAGGVSDGQRWLVFTAGSMGVGKGHSMEKLGNGILRLNNPIVADPDTLRTQLPEYQEYKQRDPLTAGLHTHKEAGLMSELLVEEALHSGKSVVQDGSLKDPTYAKKLISRVRSEHPDIKIAVVHVTAKREQILARALSRSRQIPLHLISESIERVPSSVQALTPLVDTVITVDNTGVIPRLAKPLPVLVSQYRASAPLYMNDSTATLRVGRYHPYIIPLTLDINKKGSDDD